MDWWPILSGGLAGAVTTLGVQALQRWWAKPVLEILFAENESGCRIDSPVVGGTEITHSFLRLKIRNRGRSAAMNVSASIMSLSFEAPGRGKATYDEEVLDLKVAMTEERTFRLAGRGAHRFVDLQYTQKVGDGVALKMNFVWRPASLEALGFRVGTYRPEVFLSADNAASVRRTVSWSFNGQFPGLRIEGIAR